MGNNIIIFIYLIVLIKSDLTTDEEKCKGIQPFEDVIEDCTKYTIPNSDKVCCYLELFFDEGNSYSCYPVKKDKDAIKDEIEALKATYEDCESVNIDCGSSFINLSIVVLNCLYLFF